MVFTFLTKLFGSSNDRILKKIQPIIDKIKEFDPQMQAFSDNQVGNKTT